MDVDQGADGDGYNGYANRETWAVHLWLTGSDDLRQAAAYQVEGHQDARDGAVALAEWFDDLWHQELVYTEQGRAMIHDIGSVRRVDWESIAAALAD